MRPKIFPWIALSALSGLAIGVLVWCLMVGFGGTPDEPDYFMRPIEDLVDHWLLIAAGASLVGLGVVLVILRRRSRGDITDPQIALPFLVAGGFLGALYATLTAPVVGANIGAGLLLMASPLVLGAVTVWFVLSLRGHRAA